MADNVINLRKARKEKARLTSAQKADENRVKFGEKTSIRKLRDAEENRKNKVHESGCIEKAEPKRPE